jgi:hypothetical protein
MQPRRLFVCTMLLFAACVDPVHEDAVSALGPEKRGVRPGPNHRPGQPCVTCHGKQGPGEPEFAIAGTVYLARGVLEPVSGVTVHLEDANHDKRDPQTNEVGNFFVGKTDWQPVYPITVELRDPRTDGRDGVRPMQTAVRAEGSCADCHSGAAGAPDQMPAVYLQEKAL